MHIVLRFLNSTFPLFKILNTKFFFLTHLSHLNCAIAIESCRISNKKSISFAAGDLFLGVPSLSQEGIRSLGAPSLSQQGIYSLGDPSLCQEDILCCGVPSLSEQGIHSLGVPSLSQSLKVMWSHGGSTLGRGPSCDSMNDFT